MSPIPNCGAPKKGRGVPMASTPVPIRAAQLNPHIELPIPKLLG
jgi:hypothetical protein